VCFLPPNSLHSTVGSLIPCVRPLPTNYLAILPFSLAQAGCSCMMGLLYIEVHQGVGTGLCHYVRLVFLANRFSLTLIVGKIDIGVGSKRTGNEGMHGIGKSNFPFFFSAKLTFGSDPPFANRLTCASSTRAGVITVCVICVAFPKSLSEARSSSPLSPVLIESL